MPISSLVSRQNPDGGWPYVRGGSWTEPTVYALLALHAAGDREPVRRGIEWMMRTQRSDGGWASRPDAGESSWVTGLGALLPEELIGVRRHRAAVNWLLGVTGEESMFLYRLRLRLLGIPQPADQKSPGWPWTPGAAAWVGPTSIALIALGNEVRRRPLAAAERRIQEGQAFLLARTCQDGGWNHGAAQALGYQASSYPETTGMALMALRGVRNSKMERAIALAAGFLRASRSGDAQNWLRMGLDAHGRLPVDYVPPEGIAYRTVPALALHALISSGPQVWT